MPLILQAVCDAALRRLPRAAGWAALLLLALVGRPAQPAEDIPYGEGLLWRIERPGSAPSYLFGTIHVTDERVFDLPAPVREAFDGARSLTVEVVMSQEVRLKMAQAMVLNDGRTLEAMLGPKLFGAVVEAGRRYGLPAEHLTHLKPWALATVFSLPQAEWARSATGDPPLDQWLQAEAARRGKSVFALESADEQIALFNDMPEADQIALLAAAVAENERIEAVFEDMTRLYLARDVGAILAQMRAPSNPMGPKLAEFFLLRFNQARNRIMAERMAERLREGGAFIAVGALHLPGETGLLSLLERRGYGLSRLY